MAVLLLLGCSRTIRFVNIPLTGMPDCTTQTNEGSTSKTSQDDGDNWRHWISRPSAFSGVAQAVFACLLFILTIVQSILLNHANRTARASVAQATEAIKRSDEANTTAKADLELARIAIRAESERQRGTLVFWKMQYNKAIFGFEYCYINIGAGPVIVDRKSVV